MSYRHNVLVLFYFIFVGGWGQGNISIYFKGTLENNSLFLGNKTIVRECLKIILRNKADQKKNVFVVFLPTHLYSPSQHILWHFLEIIIHFWSYCYRKITIFPFTQKRKKMHARIFCSLPTHPKIQGRGIANN